MLTGFKKFMASVADAHQPSTYMNGVDHPGLPEFMSGENPHRTGAPKFHAGGKMLLEEDEIAMPMERPFPSIEDAEPSDEDLAREARSHLDKANDYASQLRDRGYDVQIEQTSKRHVIGAHTARRVTNYALEAKITRTEKL